MFLRDLVTGTDAWKSKLGGLGGRCHVLCVGKAAAVLFLENFTRSSASTLFA